MRCGLIGAVLLAAGCGSSQLSRGTSSGSPGLGAAGAPCAADLACASGICGAASAGGAGNCCAKACGSEVPCGATACDATGACVYPAKGTACGSACAAGILSTQSCDGAGICQAGAGGSPCPDNLGCDDAGSCNQSCASPFDCAPSFTCKAGVCFPRVTSGPCGDNFDCVSGICGADGTGSCCATSCLSSALASCGAAGCDRTTGACLYADAGTPCGFPLCTPGSTARPNVCDGLGQCRTLSCAPYVCSGFHECLTSCTVDSSSCSPGAFCEVESSTCCGGLVDGGTVTVDALAGSDATPCCGFAGAPPCQTITHAMTLIKSAQAPNVRIAATLGSDGGDWPYANESSPITLGWGVELVAPGLYFQKEIAISTFPNDGGTGNASIVGTAANPVRIGISSTGQTFGSAIEVDHNNTLYIANAKLYGNNSDQSTALGIAGGLVLGQDRLGSVTGTVYVGDPAIPGGYGIYCSGCTMSDAPLQRMSSVVIQNQAVAALVLDGTSSSATVSLVSAPTIGESPSSPGFGKCPAKLGAGIRVAGDVRMTFKNGTVQCIEGAGLEMGGGGDAGPNVIVDMTTIQNASEGVDVMGGTLTISRSTIQYNYIGVWQDAFESYSSGTIDLSGGAQGGSNTVVCTSSSETPPGEQHDLGFPAIAVLNTTSAMLNASNVIWDTPGPDQFACDPTGAMCSCEIASCVNPGDVDGMDAVTTTAATILTTGHKLSSVDCASP